VQATGWKTDVSVLSKDVREQLNVQSDGLHLYRNILCPRVDGLAFIGSNVLTFMNPYTHAVQASWFASLPKREHSLPSKEEMERNLRTIQKAKFDYYPKSEVRGALVEAHMQHYIDELVYDMNRSPKRYGGLFGWAPNWLLPCERSLMAGVLLDLREGQPEGCLSPPIAFTLARRWECGSEKVGVWEREGGSRWQPLLPPHLAFPPR
jgi:hypothetical protein